MTNRRWVSFAVVAGISVVTFAVACSSDPGSTEPVSAETLQPLCAADCEQREACGNLGSGSDVVAICTMGCVDELAGWVREDAAQTILSCTSQLACDVNDDGCFNRVQPLAIHREWEMKCLETYVGCQSNAAEFCDVDVGMGSGSAPGEGGVVRVITPVVVEAMILCLDAADCPARGTCLGNVFDQYHIDL